MLTQPEMAEEEPGVVPGTATTVRWGPGLRRMNGVASGRAAGGGGNGTASRRGVGGGGTGAQEDGGERGELRR
jgi:hypothetical protein